MSNIIVAKAAAYLEQQLVLNANYVLWILDELPWFQPWTRFGLHYAAAPITNCICEANLKKLSTYNTPQRNRMLPSTLTDHDEIHQKVLNEYSNSKLKKKYTFASELILDLIEAAKFETEVPEKYRECLIDIQRTRDKLSLVFYTI